MFQCARTSADRSRNVLLQNVVLFLQDGWFKAHPAVLHRAPFSSDQVTPFNMEKKISRLNLENDQTARKPAACYRLSNLPKCIRGAFIHCYMKVICVLVVLSLGCVQEGMFFLVDS